MPTPTKTAKQKTVIRYIVRKDEDSAHREAGAQPTAQSTPHGEAPDSDGSDTPFSEAATLCGQSPETVNGEGTSQSCPNDGRSASEADEARTLPTEIEQSGGSSISYDSADNTDRPREERAQPTVPDQTSNRTGMSTCQREHEVMYNWRVDLTDNTYKYD